jgi:uncharacterized protein (DUF849 family)
MTATRIQACLNGARAPGSHPRLPLTPAQLAADAVAAVAAGAVDLHIHPRDAAGRESLDPRVIGAAVAAARAAGVPVGASTGAWIEADDAGQLAAIRGWAGLGAGRPDHASVNLSERNAPAVIAALLAAGVGVEAGLARPADADLLAALGLAPRCLRVLIEIDDMEEAAAQATADAITARLDAAGIATPRQLHGFGRSAWPMFRRAVREGLMARLGLEDVATLPDGTPAAGNAAIVAAGRRYIIEAVTPPST